MRLINSLTWRLTEIWEIKYEELVVVKDAPVELAVSFFIEKELSELPFSADRQFHTKLVFPTFYCVSSLCYKM